MSESASQTPNQNAPAHREKKASSTKSDRKSGFIDPKERDKNREEELRTLGLGELKTRYKNTYQKDAVLNEDDDEQAQKDALITDILVGAPHPPSKRQAPEGAPVEGKKKGDREVKGKNGQSYTIKGSDAGKVVVRQVQTDFYNGGIIEVPNTEQIQSYDPKYFQKLLDDNFFSESKIRIEILQDAR